MLRQDQAEQKTALVVDDDPWLRVALAAILAEAGYRVSVASNGFTGLRMARALMPHVVLLDLVLPEVSGQVVLRELRHHPVTCHVPVILMLPSVCAATPADLLEADGVLRAPVRGIELLAEVHTVTRSRRAEPRPAFTEHIMISNTRAPVLVAH